MSTCLSDVSLATATPICTSSQVLFKFKKFGCHNILQCSSMHDFESIHSGCPRQNSIGYSMLCKVAPNILGSRGGGESLGESLGEY